MNHKIQSKTHRRKNILTGEWVLVSPGRLKRPWLGKKESAPSAALPQYDPSCYLCPGNERASGGKNPNYRGTFVFDNDFSALTHESTKLEMDVDGLIQAESESGICRVICFSPRHDLTLAEMEEDQISRVIKVWKKEYVDLGKLDDVNYVQIFENKGELMGCSNPHPHCQIWAESAIPVEPAKETNEFEAYWNKTGKCKICDYVALELKQKERVVFETERFVALVPFWAVWPFEVLIAPKDHINSIAEFNDNYITDFSGALKILTVRYDNLFEISFPYSAGIHQSPTDGAGHPGWHFHMHFYPPLLRSASVKKFMVGYEMLANPQRDITAEAAAERLRGMSDVHYKNRKSK
jgi:UDPglucose--hexose-1-phosphate uridylyltransferase